MRANAPRQFGSAMPGNPRNLPLVGAPKKIATIAAGEGNGRNIVVLLRSPLPLSLRNANAICEGVVLRLAAYSFGALVMPCLQPQPGRHVARPRT